MKRDLVIAVDRDLVEIAVPGFAWIDPELLVRLAGEQVPGALDVAGGERLAVMPLDAVAQCEAQCGPFLVPRPRGGQIGHDRLRAVLLHMLIEHDEVVEHPHHWPQRRYGRFLVDRHAGGAVEMRHPENAAWFLRVGPHRERQRDQQRGCCEPTKISAHPSLSSLMATSDPIYALWQS